MADPIAVANAFVTHYNSLFDSPDRTSLAPLYVSRPPAAQLKYHWSSRTLRPHRARGSRECPRCRLIRVLRSRSQQDSSMLTYEGKQIQGQAAIINEYANPASPRINHATASTLPLPPRDTCLADCPVRPAGGGRPDRALPDTNVGDDH